MAEAPKGKPSLSLNSELILDEALRRKISSEYVLGSDYYILSYKNNIKTLRTTRNSLGFSSHAMRILNDKHQTKLFLKRAKIIVPEGLDVSVTDRQELIKTFEKFKKPLVMKPASETYGGESVFLNIVKCSDFLKKIKYCQKRGYKKVVIEEQFQNGTEYRIFATKNDVVAISLRTPANVIGDGAHSISELIEIKNSDSRRGGHDYRKPLLKIEVDDSVKNFLKKQNLSIKSVPEKSRVVYLRKNSNLSTGGDSIDCTDLAHESVKKIALKAVNAIPELPYVGIDFMTLDITKPQTENSYVIIEMNASPMISMHHSPYQGKPRDAAKAIIDTVFPETKE